MFLAPYISVLIGLFDHEGIVDDCRVAEIGANAPIIRYINKCKIGY